MSKAEHELGVFKAFVCAARLPIAIDSIKCEDPPAPDVSCLLKGTPVYFELTRAAAQDIADDVGRSFRRVKTERVVVGQAHPYDDRQILENAVGRKAGAHHETNGRDLHLLVYYDGVFHAVGGLDVVEPIYRDLQGRFQDRWTAMWLFDQPSGTVIGPRKNGTAD